MTRIPAGERRKDLVAAAIRVMARDGVEKATTRAITAEAGMPVGFFHYCFHSKEELLVQVLEAINEQTRNAVLKAVKPRGDLRETLQASMRAVWRELESRAPEHQLTYELTQYALRKPALAEVARKQYELYYANVREFLGAVAEACRIEWTVPGPALVRYVHAVIDGTILTWIVDRDRKLSLAALNQLAEHLAASARQRVSS